MANTQLIAYVNAQLDKGVAREAITQALIGAGWLPADVEAAVTEVTQQRGPATAVAAQPSVQPMTSYSQPTASTQPAASVTPASFFATTSAASSFNAAEAAQPRRSLTWVFILVGIVLALGIVGGLVYMFMGGSGSAAAPAVDNAAVAQQLASTTQERDQLRTEVTTLSDNVTSLTNELSIFQTTTTVAVPLTIKGTLSTTTTNAWILTTPHAIVLTISNVKDAGVAAALMPLKGAEVELTGTHTSGSTLFKISGINGSAISTAPTSTAPTMATTTPKAGNAPKSGTPIVP